MHSSVPMLFLPALKHIKLNDIVNHTMMLVGLWAVDMNVNRIQLEYEEVWI